MNATGPAFRNEYTPRRSFKEIQYLALPGNKKIYIMINSKYFFHYPMSHLFHVQSAFLISTSHLEYRKLRYIILFRLVTGTVNRKSYQSASAILKRHFGYTVFGQGLVHLGSHFMEDELHFLLGPTVTDLMS